MNAMVGIGRKADGKSAGMIGRLKTISLLLATLVFSLLAGCLGTYYDGTNPWKHDFSEDCSGLSSSVDGHENIHLIWMEAVERYKEEVSDLYYMKLDPNGRPLIDRTLIRSEMIEDPEKGNPQCVLGTDSRNTAHIAFTMNGVIRYLSIDCSGRRSDPETLSVPGVWAMDPDLCVDEDDNVHIVWTDFKNDEAKVLYMRKCRTGHTTMPIREIEGFGSYDPSLCVDPEGRIYIAYYLEYTKTSDFYDSYVTDDTIYRSIVLKCMDMALNNVDIVDLNISTFTAPELDSLDMVLTEDGSPVIFWTSYSYLYTYSPPTYELLYPGDGGELEFDIIGGKTANLELVGFSPFYMYNITAEIVQGSNYGCNGDLMMNIDGGVYEAIGEYTIDHSFGLSTHNDMVEVDVTDRIGSNCSIWLTLDEGTRMGDPVIEMVTLSIVPTPKKEKEGIGVLARDGPVGNPVGSAGTGSETFFAWSDNKGQGEVYFGRMESPGGGVVYEVMVHSGPEPVKELDLHMVKGGDVQLVWISSDDDNNVLRHSRVDRGGGVEVAPHSLSKTPREWHWYDDLGGSVPAALLLSAPIIAASAITAFMVRRWKRKRTVNKAVLPIILQVDVPEGPVEFEVVSERWVRPEKLSRPSEIIEL
ncbi:MAG: hypothetical protein MUC62_09400 [Candidatus Thermoplasmatota archaeon]|jgi:hypothetical protein|nr:hypothetical protein [Candidatus Thermoplasmatota archaeon]